MRGTQTARQMGQTTISLPDELADELYRRKDRGESYADVVERLIERADATDAPESGERAPQYDGSADTGVDVTDETHAASDATLRTLVDTVGRDALPGSGAKLDERADALRAVVEYLQDHGTATPADFQNDVYPDHPARYTPDAATNPARSWWKNAMYPGLRALAEHTDEIEKADQSGEWSYVGGDDALDTGGPYDPSEEFN